MHLDALDDEMQKLDEVGSDGATDDGMDLDIQNTVLFTFFEI